jgi:NADPH:quinone reductase-like Zn-dependent oxidoreductase
MGVKAVVYDRYGSPNVLHVEEVPLPTPVAGQVRVKIAATSVNLSDWECLRGSPAYARIGGLRSRARRTLGSDIAGVIDEVGDGVTRFRPGDEVYGDNLALMGGFAEYAVAPVAALAHRRTGSRSPTRPRSRSRARSLCRGRTGRWRGAGC